MTVYKFFILFGILTLAYCLFQLISFNYLSVTVKIDYNRVNTEKFKKNEVEKENKQFEVKQKQNHEAEVIHIDENHEQLKTKKAFKNNSISVSRIRIDYLFHYSFIKAFDTLENELDKIKFDNQQVDINQLKAQNKYIRGSHFKDFDKYQPDDDNHFTCFKSGVSHFYLIPSIIL